MVVAAWHTARELVRKKIGYMVTILPVASHIPMQMLDSFRVDIIHEYHQQMKKLLHN